MPDPKDQARELRQKLAKLADEENAHLETFVQRVTMLHGPLNPINADSAARHYGTHARRVMSRV